MKDITTFVQRDVDSLWFEGLAAGTFHRRGGVSSRVLNAVFETGTTPSAR